MQDRILPSSVAETLFAKNGVSSTVMLNKVNLFCSNINLGGIMLKRRTFAALMVVIFVMAFATMAMSATVKQLDKQASKYWKSKQFQKCYDTYQILIKKDPKRAAWHQYLAGNCKIHLDKVNEAFPEYLEALQKPDCPNKQKDSIHACIMSTLGEFAAYEGKPDVILEAINYYGKKRYARDTHSYRAWHAGHFGDSTLLGKTKVKDIMTYYLALAYYNSGDKAKAKETLEARAGLMKGYVSLDKRDCPKLEDEVPALLAKCN